MTDVFISYHHDDEAVAQQLCEKLEKAGISVWYAGRDVKPGHLISRAVMNAMKQCGTFVFILSKSGIYSDFFLNELQYAKILIREERRDIRLIPLVIDEEGKSALSTRMFQGIPWFNAISSLDNSLSQAVKWIAEQALKQQESAS